MLGLFTHCPFALRSAVKGISSDMEWWASLLIRPTLQCSIPRPVNLYDIGAFSDASSGVGIAIVVQGRWRIWRLIPGWQTLDGKRDIGWAEPQRLLASSVLSTSSAAGNMNPDTSLSMVTTKELLRVGGMVEARLGQSMISSDTYTSWHPAPYHTTGQPS
jgi:hypothetical protein